MLALVAVSALHTTPRAQTPIAPQVEEVKGKEEEIVNLERQAAQREQRIVDLERSVEELSGQVGEGGGLAWGGTTQWSYLFVCCLAASCSGVWGSCWRRRAQGAALRC